MMVSASCGTTSHAIFSITSLLAFESASRSTHHKGLGLGLYIARQVVDAHGGEIRVDSTRGGGSTFTVELPLAALGPRT